MPLSRFQKILIVVGILFVLGAGGAAYLLLRPEGNQPTQHNPATSGALTGSSSPQNLTPLPLSPTGTTPTSSAPLVQIPPAIPSETSTIVEAGTPPPRP